jgi:hypothetical protein
MSRRSWTVAVVVLAVLAHVGIAQADDGPPEVIRFFRLSLTAGGDTEVVLIKATGFNGGPGAVANGVDGEARSPSGEILGNVSGIVVLVDGHAHLALSVPSATGRYRVVSVSFDAVTSEGTFEETQPDGQLLSGTATVQPVTAADFYAGRYNGMEIKEFDTCGGLQESFPVTWEFESPGTIRVIEQITRTYTATFFPDGTFSGTGSGEIPGIGPFNGSVSGQVDEKKIGTETLNFLPGSLCPGGTTVYGYIGGRYH